ncbi:MAG: LysR family transcriptional regulator [Alphaproteobacteria bacterium]
MYDLRAMSIFVAVVEYKTMQAAADKYHLTVSTVSQAITKLEKNYHIKLLNRTTRKLALTEAGELFYQGCRDMLNGAEKADFSLQNLRDNIGGKVRLAVFSTIANSFSFCNALRNIQTSYPELSIELLVKDGLTDLLDEKIDIAIRGGEGALDNPQMIARLLQSYPMITCVGSDFFCDGYIPKHPKDLMQYPWIGPPNSGSICFQHEHMGEYIFSPERHLECDNSLMRREMLLQNLGIAIRIQAEIQHELNDKKIIQILPDWKLYSVPLYLITLNRNRPKKVNIVIDAISQAFKIKSQ